MPSQQEIEESIQKLISSSSQKKRTFGIEELAVTQTVQNLVQILMIPKTILRAVTICCFWRPAVSHFSLFEMGA